MAISLHSLLAGSRRCESFECELLAASLKTFVAVLLAAIWTFERNLFQSGGIKHLPGHDTSKGVIAAVRQPTAGLIQHHLPVGLAMIRASRLEAPRQGNLAGGGGLLVPSARPRCPSERCWPATVQQARMPARRRTMPSGGRGTYKALSCFSSVDIGQNRPVLLWRHQK